PPASARACPRRHVMRQMTAGTRADSKASDYGRVLQSRLRRVLLMLLRGLRFSSAEVIEACSSEEPPKIDGGQVGLGYKRGSAALQQVRSRDLVDSGGGQHD